MDACERDARPVSRCWIWAIFGLGALLRIVALSSDAYGRLDWSAALLTDEGFYTHNARNVALFGEARTDEFNNMLLAPLLHGMQVVVFRLFGVGIVQARSISVVCSLLTLLVFWAAMRRVFGERVALTATLFLAFDHTNALFNRMALLDTPAALPAIGALYAFIRGVEPAPDGHRRQWIWLALSGVLLGLTVTNRMLAAYLLPVPFIVAWASRTGLRAAAPVAAGLAVVAAVYMVGWYLPHRSEIAAMNRYYRTNQIQPKSVAHLANNVRQAVVGDHRGMSPYLMRHSPVVYLLALAGLGAALMRSGRGSAERAAVTYLAAWFALGWLLLAVVSYSPSRYYVTLYPAMAGLAAIALWRLPEMGEQQTPSTRWGMVGLGTFAAFHAALAVVHYRGVLAPGQTAGLLYGIPAAAAIGLALGGRAILVFAKKHRTRMVPAALVAWALVNALWLSDWARKIDFTQVRLSRWLGEALPRGSVLIGDVSPGVTIDNGFKAIHVQPGLANYRQPVERFAGSPRYVVILDGRWKEQFWLKEYPELVDPARRVKLARVLRWDVGVYSVDRPPTTLP